MANQEYNLGSNSLLSVYHARRKRQVEGFRVSARMNPEDVVAFFERRGQRVVRSSSCWWYNEYRNGQLLYAFPPYRLISPNQQEISDVFRKSPGIKALRFIGSVDGPGKQSFIWTCSGRYDLSTLHEKARNKVRRGLENCVVRSLDWNALILLARQAHEDTLVRHGFVVNDKTGLGLDRSLGGCPAYEAWGAFVDEHLAAYAVTLSIENWAYILIQESVTSYLKFRPNNALVYAVARELLARPATTMVSYGLEYLEPLESLAHFKRSMGFVKQPVRQRVVMSPWLRSVFNPFVCRLIVNVCQLRADDSLFLRKLAWICLIIQQG